MPQRTGTHSPPGRFPKLVVKVVGAAAATFYRVDRHGPSLPDGPLLVAANHPNSLLDPILVFRCSERDTRPLARAPLFDKTLLGTILRALGAIPVHRREDDPEKMHLNEEMFREATSVLLEGGAIQIFPEGRSHSHSSLAQFRTGAARIALRAEDAAGWRLGLSIVPVGITYSRKERARTSVAVRFGSPFSCADLQDAHRHDPMLAARMLTRRIRGTVRDLTLNFADPRDRKLVEMAEQMYVRESRWVPWRARERLGTRFPRLQRFAAGLEWIRREAPEEHEALVAKVERYAALHAYVGAGRGDVPPRYALTPVAHYIAVRGTILLLVLPAALAGILVWAPVVRLPAFVVARAKPDFEVEATYKLATLIFGGALAWALWVAAAYVAGGTTAAAVAAVAAPACGYAAVQWLELVREVREDAALFLRLQGRPDVRRQFARLRKDLAATFRQVERRLLSFQDRGNVSPSLSNVSPSGSAEGVPSRSVEGVPSHSVEVAPSQSVQGG